MSYSDDVLAAGEAFAAFLETLSPEPFRHSPSPEAWSAAEIAGHAAEVPVTFARQCVALAATPGLHVGRALDDPGRLAALERTRGMSPAEAAAAIRAVTAEAAAILATVPVGGWHAVGVHPRFGEFPNRRIAEEFIRDHLRGHLAEARAAAAAAVP